MKLTALSTTTALALVLGLTACSPGEDDAAGPDRAVTEITQEQGTEGLDALNLTDNAQVSWAERSYEDGVFTFSELVFAPEGEKAGTETVTVEQLVLTAPRVDEDGHARFDSLEALGLHAGEGEEQVRLARAFVEYPGPGLSTLIADALSGRMENENYEAPFEELAEYRFDALGMEGLEMSAAEGEAPLQFALNTFAFDNFDGETLARMSMEGLSVTGEDPETGPLRFGLAEFSVEGLAGGLLQTMIEAEGDPEAAMQAMSQWMMPTNLYDAITVRDLDIDAAGVAVAMPEMTANIEESGDEIVMTSAMPSLSITGEEGTETGGQLAMALGMLGYDSFDFSMRGESVFDRDEDRVYTRGENFLALEDGFVIRFDQDFSGFEAYVERYSELMSEVFAEAESGKGEPTMLDEDINAMMLRAYEPLVLNSLRIAIEDQSLFDRALSAAAEQQGSTPDAVRNQLVGLVGMGVMMAPPEVPRPMIAAASQAITSFVQQGGTLVIAADPEDPVSVGEIMEAANAGNFDAEMVGLEVTHEAPEGGEEN